MASLYFEDFVPGTATPYGSVTVDKDEMLAFAREFDAQPMHLSESMAERTMAGGLIASGWFTAALNMRMMAESFILDTASMGSPGVSQLKWSRPVKAGDRLHGIRHVVDRRPSLTKPDRGFVNFRFEVMNQRNETVMEQTNLIMIGRRGGESVTDAAAKPFSPEPEPALPIFHDGAPDTLPFFEDLVVGERLALGDIHVTAEDIIRFGRVFDPQTFHVDAVLARQSIFGGLIASGWHTAANWMRLMVQNRTAATMAAMMRGERPARLGPSPGFSHLRWIKPVFVGDRITYTSAITEKRVSQSKPEWGIVRHYNTGTNQRGETVFAFHGTVFWERKPRQAS